MSNALQRLRERLQELARTELRASYHAADASLPVAASKIGGAPDVPAGFVWPEYTGASYNDDEPKCRPLSFLAQINLADVSPNDAQGLLPASGVLSFFYDLVTMTWGMEPGDRGSARVFYFPDASALSPCELPSFPDEDSVLPELAMQLTPHISLPCYESFEDASIDVDWEEYDDLCADMGYSLDDDGYGEITKLLGYPNVIQSPMEEDCEQVTLGFGTGSPEEYAKVPRDMSRQIRARAKDWTLLFQMGTVSHEDYELMFGDCGHIYFWIRQEDLLARSFDNIWLILQCA